MTLPDVLRVARAYGLATERITHTSELGAKVRSVLDSPGPVVCEVVAPPDEICAPRLASAQRPDGSMESRPLEDLWPFLDREELRRNLLIPMVEE